MTTKAKTSLFKPPQKSGATSTKQKVSLPWQSVVPLLPSSPGVYWFVGKNRKILYVGKAKNLTNRVRSYTNYHQLNLKTKKLVTTAVELKYQELGSELEALLVEAELIRLHQPQFNILLKDDKTPLYIHITNEKFPRVLTVRKKDVETKQIKTSGTTLGPFPSGYKVRQVLQIARSIFPWCNQRANNPVSAKACFFQQIELCPGACIGQISQSEYKEQMKNLIQFLRGNKKGLLKQLKQEMLSYADQEKFEKAGQIKEKLQLIEQVTSKEHKLKPEFKLPQLNDSFELESILYLTKLISQHGLISRSKQISRIEGYDVSNIQGKNAAVAMVVFTDGKADYANYRLFNIKTLSTPNDYHMLKEAILRRQNHPEWGKPDLLVIDGGRGQLRSALSVWGWDCPVISIAKHPDRIIIPTKIDGSKIEYAIHKLPDDHPALKLVQQIRDESHRFSKKQFSRRHLKSMFK